jgi:hypothetical protein
MLMLRDEDCGCCWFVSGPVCLPSRGNGS